jgi:hypothetical protein
MDTSAVTVFAALILARLLVPLFIPRFPLPGILGAIVLDAIDHTVFQAFGEVDLAAYQSYDKALDIYYLTIAYASTIRNWEAGPAFALGRVLWYYRLVGVALFEFLESRWLLLLFPNVFEYYFAVIEALKVSRNPFRLTIRQLAAVAAVIWIGIKLPQEWWIHVAELDLTDFVKVHLFGAPVSSPWTEAIANRPLAAAALLTAGGVLLLGLRVVSSRLPRGDWEPTLAADTQATHLGWPVPGRETVPSAFFGWPFVEKATLVALVTLIFGQILPGQRKPAQMVLGMTLVIAVSTFISQWLVRREVTWRSIGIQFLAMAISNLGIAFLIGEFWPLPGRRMPVTTLVFLIALLTLIVVLFDRGKYIGRRRRLRPLKTPPSRAP